MPQHLPRLYYQSNNKWKLLPEWAYFFMMLGYKLAEKPTDKYRFVIGLAIPTREFACGLVSIGSVLGKVDVENMRNYEERLQFIRNLKPGTPVFVHGDENRKVPGIALGVSEFQGKQLIRIRTGKSEETGYPIKQYASRITISEKEIALPRYKNKGHLTETPSKFLQCCLGKDAAEKHILDSSSDLLMVGKKTVIERDVTSVPFRYDISTDNSEVIGYLQEILRVRQFSGENKPYQAQCISSSNFKPEKEIGPQLPTISIFDGAVAYLNLGHIWNYSHQVVLLERTERQFSEAVDLLHQNLAVSLPGSFKFPIKIPNGIDMMIYRDSIQ